VGEAVCGGAAGAVFGASCAWLASTSQAITTANRICERNSPNDKPFPDSMEQALGNPSEKSNIAVLKVRNRSFLY
jgi:hypothetical protein